MPSFKNAISKPGRINLIAEIKRKSPSAGIIIKNNFNPARLAKVYQNSGASAISVLTNNDLFGGGIRDLKDVKRAVTLPVLRKDFIETIKEVEKSARAGSDAILLIARNLSVGALKMLYKASYAMDMDVIVEIHTKQDLKKISRLDPEIIGINNRDLKTLKTDIRTTERLIGLIPEDKIIISESGIKDRKDIEYLKGMGVHAVLIGETLLKSRDIYKKARELIARPSL